MNADTFDIRVTVPSTLAADRNIFHNGLQGWGCGNLIDMLLVFSELVTNATVHTSAASTTVSPRAAQRANRRARQLARDPSATTRHSAGRFRSSHRQPTQRQLGLGSAPTGKVVWSIIPCGH